MKKHLTFLTVILLSVVLMGCGGNEKNPSSSKVPDSTSKAPVKTISDLSISLENEGEKAIIKVRGTQRNYTADTFKWAWGLKGNDGTFDDGKAIPEAADFKEAQFDSNNQFTVKYYLTDITTIKAGKLYRIYGGTPETYGDIPFASNQFGAKDVTRNYYLRQDENNALTFDNIQPINFTLASIEEITTENLPTDITNPGAYLKVGGVNSKNLTVETINSWDDAGNIAGYFQCCIPSWSTHTIAKDERFWTIEENNVFFHFYVGFIEAEEGWMTHFDVVSGNEQAGLKTTTKFAGETDYTINGATYKIYSDTDKGTEENYWGCLGVYREA